MVKGSQNNSKVARQAINKNTNKTLAMIYIKPIKPNPYTYGVFINGVIQWFYSIERNAIKSQQKFISDGYKNVTIQQYFKTKIN